MKILEAIARFVITNVLRLVSLILFRVKIVGKENFPKEGGCIVCGNHISNWDPVQLVIWSPRRVRFMAKKELFKSAFMRFLAYLYGIFSVDRNGKDIEAIKTSLKILKNDEVLGIFPEGTRNGLEKNADVKNGAAYIALKTGKQVIPVGIKGNFKPFRKVIITYGKPIDFTEYKTRDKAQEKENLEKVSNIIMDNIISLTK